MHSINVLDALSSEDQGYLAQLLMTQGHPVKFNSGEDYTIIVNNQPFTIQLSNPITSRESECEDHPGRIWFDVFINNRSNEGNFGVVCKSTRSFRLDDTSAQLVIKDRNQPAKTKYIAKTMKPDSDLLLDERVKMAFKELTLSGMLHLPGKKHLKSPTIIGDTISILLAALPGQNLLDYIESAEAFDLGFGRFLSICMQTTQGLENLHQVTQHLHMDVKLANLMYSHKLNKINYCDFGLALPISEAAASPESWGTPGYMAPEVWNGTANTVQSDAYSCAKTIEQIINLLELGYPMDRLYQFESDITLLLQALPILQTMNPLFQSLQPQVRYNPIVERIKILCLSMQFDDPTMRITLDTFFKHLQQLASDFLKTYGELLKSIDTAMQDHLLTDPSAPPALVNLSELIASGYNEWLVAMNSATDIHSQLVMTDDHLSSVFDSIEFMLRMTNKPAVAASACSSAFFSVPHVLQEQRVENREFAIAQDDAANILGLMCLDPCAR